MAVFPCDTSKMSPYGEFCVCVRVVCVYGGQSLLLEPGVANMTNLASQLASDIPSLVPKHCVIGGPPNSPKLQSAALDDIACSDFGLKESCL